MAHTEPARATNRRVARIPVAGLLIPLAAIAIVLGYQARTTSSSTTSPSTTSSSPVEIPGGELPPVPPGALPGIARTHNEGALPDRTTVFDDQLAGVANLDPALLDALRRAALDAGDDGVQLVVQSGWRSAEYQQHLLNEAIAKYGSSAEAARWVTTPNTSAHVSGDAVDIGPPAAAAWVSKHGFRFGLCRTYRNEPWHFELRPDAARHGCPTMYADPTDDPRHVPTAAETATRIS